MVKAAVEKKEIGPKALITTINLHKRLHRVTFKRKAPRAIKEIKKFAAQTMGTSDVKIGSRLNAFIWHRGVRNVPYRVRVKLTRKRSDDEKAALYTTVEFVDAPAGFKGLQPEIADVDEE